MQKSFLIIIIIILIFCVTLCGCGRSSPDTVEQSIVIETTPTPAPSAKHCVIAVKDDSPIKDEESFVTLCLEKSLTVSAEGRGALAAACYEALNDIRFSFSDARDENADAYVFFEDDIPSGYRTVISLDLSIWEDETPEQSQVYAELEQELKYYLN